MSALAILFILAFYVVHAIAIVVAFAASSQFRFPKTEREGLAVPGSSESPSAPKGLGWPENKPLMRNPFVANERHSPIGIITGDIFDSHLELTPALARKLKVRFLNALAGHESNIGNRVRYAGTTCQESGHPVAESQDSLAMDSPQHGIAKTQFARCDAQPLSSASQTILPETQSHAPDTMCTTSGVVQDGVRHSLSTTILRSNSDSTVNPQIPGASPTTPSRLGFLFCSGQLRRMME